MVGLIPPKFVLLRAPHSPSAALFARLQSGTKFPLVSFHVRVTVLIEVVIGLSAMVMFVLFLATYRPIATLTAVLPSPNTSQAAPHRGSQSFHKGELLISGSSRA